MAIITHYNVLVLHYVTYFIKEKHENIFLEIFS